MFFRPHTRNTKVAIGGTFYIEGLAGFLDFLAAFDWKGVKKVETSVNVHCDTLFSP